MILLLALVVLQAATLLTGAATLWCALRMKRAVEFDAEQLRPIRLQLSNIIAMLLGAGFKVPPRHMGWEDDFHATQLRDTAPEVSWWRPKKP